MSSGLTKPQSSAINYIREYARTRKRDTLETIKNILQMSNISQKYFDDSISEIKARMRVALHFHPDRLDPDMKTVAEALFESGFYKSQFETLLSSGSVSAHPGGARDLWEKKLFGNAYNSDNSQRPKYGSLDLMCHPDGPSPRFGSCYFLLKAEVSKRCTFTYMDSHLDPDEKGVFDEFDIILAALLTDSFSDEIVLGEPHLRPPQLLQHLLYVINQSFSERLNKPHRRILDHYIEAQIHGDISLSQDVDALVADPSFKDSAPGACLLDIGRKFGIDIHWHAGFAMPPEDVPADFRGASMPFLAKRVAPNGALDARKIGEAAASLRKNFSAWADIGNEKDVLEKLRHLWHILLRFGEPIQSLK